MFRALHSYLSLTSHSLLHLSPNVQLGCEWVLTPHLPVHHCGCLSPRRASPESNDVEGVSLEVRQTKWTHILAHLTDSPARTGPNCKNARPNRTFLDSLVYWRLLIVPDCFEDMRVHLRLVRTWDLEVFEQQTAFETKQVSMLSGPT